jgi:hypothetical protein
MENNTENMNNNNSDADKNRLILDMVHHNPGELMFESQFTNPLFLKKFGYSGIVISSHVQAVATLKNSDARIPPPSSDENSWIEAYATKIQKQISDAKEAGLLCLAWSDFVVLPKRVFDTLGNLITTTNTTRHEYEIKGAITPDINSPDLQQLLNSQLDEIFERFPLLDGLVVRVGETYLHDLPYHAGGDPITAGAESHIIMLKLLRENVCVKHNKKLVYRTWLSGIDEDRALYLKVADSIEPHPNLIFSIKHCIGDFHRTHPFSPPLGFGRQQQIVEIQCQREYEGKGAYPNYIAGGVMEGFPEYEYIQSDTTIRGVEEITEA